MSIKSLVKRVLIQKENRRYQKLLSDKCVSYSDWMRERERTGWSQGADAVMAVQSEVLSGQRKACGNATGVELADEIVVICASEGRFAEHAFENIARYFTEHSEIRLLYGDEDVFFENEQKGDAENGSVQNAIACEEDRGAPWFKPDWSPDLLDSRLYFGSVVAVRRSLFEQCCKVFVNAGGERDTRRPFEAMSQDGVTGEKVGDVTSTGMGESTGKSASIRESVGKEIEIQRVTDAKAYERWIYICVGLAGGYRKGGSSIGHFSGILFHCSCEAEQRKFLEFTPFLQQRRREFIEAFRESEACTERISVVVPSKDNPEILKKCIEGCLTVASMPLEIIVVDNGSSAVNKCNIESMLDEFRAKTAGGCVCDYVYLYEPMEFNFSRMCNMGAKRAKGSYLLFLNDDVELCQVGCLEEMAACSGRAYTGAVGLKLYYPDSKKIQHAGITNLPMGPVHKLQFKDDNMRYYYKANSGRRNVLAVTAACLMVERDKYLEAGGFAEELKVAFNDVDFCFRLYELGYHNVCVNDSFAYHHESLSRGADESFEKLERLLGEREKLYARHSGLEGVDPYYSIYLNREGLDTSIRPDYVTAANRTQQIHKSMKSLKLADYRQDNCLMFRVEDVHRRRMIGYGVVLGDNNACYEKTLLLREVDEQARPEIMKDVAEEAVSGIQREAVEKASKEDNGWKNEPEVYAVQISGQYRPDLEENLCDQVNVALSGFDLKPDDGAIPKGRYLVGMAAKNRVTGLRLVNWSNRVVEL